MININRSEAGHKQQLERLQRGIWIGTEPFGYTRDYENFDYRDHRPIIVDKQHSHYVQQMFQMYSTGKYSLRKLQEIANNDWGLPISRNAINTILNNEFYCGIMVVNGIPYPHYYEQIIERDIFNKVQAILKIKNARKKGATKPQNPKNFLYRSLIKCATCFCTMSPTLQKKMYIYYGCTLAKIKHQRRYIQEKVITKQLMDKIEKLPEGKAIKLMYDLSKLENQHIILKYLFSEIKVDAHDILHVVENDTSSLEELKQKLSGEQPDSKIEIYTPKVEGELATSLLKFCSKPKMINEILSYTKLLLPDLQNILFDLQMQNEIEEVEMGIWKSKG